MFCKRQVLSVFFWIMVLLKYNIVLKLVFVMWFPCEKFKRNWSPVFFDHQTDTVWLYYSLVKYIAEVDIKQGAAFSIAADVRCYTLSVYLQSLVTYFMGRKSVGYFGFGKIVAITLPPSNEEEPLLCSCDYHYPTASPLLFPYPYLPLTTLWQWHHSVFTGHHRWAAVYFL